MPRAKGIKNADYEVKRRELLRRMLPRFVRLDLARPSLRQLAVAAEVTAPTLQHYFGDRTGVVSALLENARRDGEQRLNQVSQPAGPFEASMRAFTHGFIDDMQARGGVRGGDVVAASVAEGLADPKLSPLALAHIIDPTVEALIMRLQRHAADGEMIETDLRAAALVLLSPLLFGVLHQDQMGGRDGLRLELSQLAEEVACAFVRAYGKRRRRPDGGAG